MNNQNNQRTSTVQVTVACSVFTILLSHYCLDSPSYLSICLILWTWIIPWSQMTIHSIKVRHMLRYLDELKSVIACNCFCQFSASKTPEFCQWKCDTIMLLSLKKLILFNTFSFKSVFPPTVLGKEVIEVDTTKKIAF